MALATYSDLRREVAMGLQKDGLSAYASLYITLCGAKLNRELRVRQMENRATATLNSQYIVLPTDYLELRNIQLNNHPLTYVTPEQLDSMAAGWEAGEPNYYTMVGGEIQVGKIPSASEPYTIEISYYQKIPELSDAQTTNWLLTSHPDIYYYGSLAEAPIPGADMWQQKYLGAVASLKRSDDERWSGSVLRMRVNV